jgi:transmembrane protein 132
MRQEDFSVTCSLRYQQSFVDVYARFKVPDGVRSQFLVHQKALFRVTDLVENRLRIADTSIATLEGRVIEGLQPGRTEIQVSGLFYLIFIVAHESVGI